MIPNCREVARALASDQVESAGVWRRLSIRLHLLMCAHCSRYARQLVAIGAAARRLVAQSPTTDRRLDDIEKSLVDRLRAGPRDAD